MVLVPTLGLALVAQTFAVRAGRSRNFYLIYRTDAPAVMRELRAH